MKFSINRLIFCKAVTDLSRAVATRSTNPVLEGIYIKSEGENLKLASYNYEIGMEKTVEAIKIEEEGKIVINAKLLGEMLRRLDNEVITIISNDKNVCTIEGRSTVYEINGMAADDFPSMPTLENQVTVNIPTEQLKDMVRQTIFAVAVGETTRPMMTGEHFEIGENSINVVALDGVRLALRHENLKGNEEISFTASAKAISEAVKLIGENDKVISINIGRRFFSLTVDGYTIVSRLMEGEYFDYRQTFKGDDNTVVKIKTKNVIDIIERISLLINDQVKTPVRMKIDKDMITFSCSTVLGKAFDTCDAEIEGEPMEIGFNARYLEEALKATECEEVVLKFSTPNTRMMILPINGDNFIYMVMPMRLKESNE